MGSMFTLNESNVARFRSTRNADENCKGETQGKRIKRRFEDIYGTFNPSARLTKIDKSRKKQIKKSLQDLVFIVLFLFFSLCNKATIIIIIIIK